MKPEDLIPPFPKDQKKIVVHDRVWYLPDTHLVQNDFHFPGWQDSLLFDNSNPVSIEYCNGNGAWIAAQALAHPEMNCVAIEKKFIRVRKIWSKIKNLKINNLIVICGEGLRATLNYFPTASVSEIFINF